MLNNKNSINQIARVLPILMVESFDKQDAYSAQNVKQLFNQAFKSEHNMAYALAMLCSQSEFDAFFPELNYQHLRHDIAKVCFENWPRFNIDSLLMYANNKTHGDSGFFAGGGDSGCGGE